MQRFGTEPAANRRAAIGLSAAFDITPQARSLVDIYKMTNTHHPECLAYVGQAVQVLSNGQAHGTSGRVAAHFREAYATRESGCTALNAAIREEYSKAAWQVETLESIPYEDADAAEVFWIDHFNTYKGSGYNLTPGGRYFEVTAEMRAKISKGVRKHDTDRSMYIYQVSNQHLQGYGVSIPVIGKQVVFTASNLSMPTKLARAEAYLKACIEALAEGSEIPVHQTDTRPSSLPSLPRYISKFTRKGKVYLRVYCKPKGKPVLFDKKFMSGSLTEMLSKAKAYVADQNAKHDIAGQQLSPVICTKLRLLHAFNPIWQTTISCIVFAAYTGVSHTVQPMMAASDFDNQENSGTISSNTTPKQQTYHHASTKGKLQKAAQAPGQSKIAFAIQKQCS